MPSWAIESDDEDFGGGRGGRVAGQGDLGEGGGCGGGHYLFWVVVVLEWLFLG